MVVQQSALFNFQSFLTLLLLLICTCAYVHARTPSLLDSHKQGCENWLHRAAIFAIFDELFSMRHHARFRWQIRRFRGLLWKCARIGTYFVISITSIASNLYRLLHCDFLAKSLCDPFSHRDNRDRRATQSIRRLLLRRHGSPHHVLLGLACLLISGLWR